MQVERRRHRLGHGGDEQRDGADERLAGDAHAQGPPERGQRADGAFDVDQHDVGVGHRLRLQHHGAADGAQLALAEAYRNVAATGATPLAVTNCLNFGNPQRPEIMHQFVECLRGMGDACRALDFPIVSGNVSLYNESKATGGGSAILPTPAIGGVGLLEDWEQSVGIALRPGMSIVLIGDQSWPVGLERSIWLEVIQGKKQGNAQRVNLSEERSHGEFVRQLVANGHVTAVHDISDGGILIALAEMALAGNCGTQIDWNDDAHFWFGEHQSCYLLTTPDPNGLLLRASDAGVLAKPLGTTGGDSIKADGWSVSLADLRAAHEGFFPKLMGAEAALA